MTESDRTKNYVRKGVLWNSLNSIARYGLVFLGTIILARMLTPDDYGLLGVLTVFITVAEVLIDAGLGGAVIKKRNATESDYSTLMVYNLFVSVIIYATFYFAAPTIGDFYGKPVLVKILRLYSIVILIFAVTIVPKVQLIKQLRFKALSIISLIAGVSGLSVAIFLASKGYGVISLVWQYIINAFVTSVLLWIVSKYKMKFKFSYLSFKEQFAFGINTTLANSLKAVSDNIYANIIGKISTMTQTGFYAQSSRLSAVPTSFLFNLIDSTFFPIFSQETNSNTFVKNIEELNRKIIYTILILFCCSIPICKELIEILLGNQWIEAEQTLEILLISCMFVSIANIGRNILKCLGRTYIILKAEINIFLLSIVLLTVSSFLGYYYIVYSFLTVAIIRAVYVNHIAYKHIGISAMTLFRPVLKILPWIISGIFLAFTISFCENVNLFLSVVLKLILYGFCIALGLVSLKKKKILNK